MTQEDNALIVVILIGCLLGYLAGLCVSAVVKWYYGWTR